MKRILIAFMICIFALSSGCSTTQKAKQGVGKFQGVSKKILTVPNLKTTSKGNASSVSKHRIFTTAQLKKYNGQNGNPAYVAVDGVVYDVTNASNWSNGRHFEGIAAGNDLSKAILRSPHGKSVLKSLPVVGTFKK